MKTRKRGRLAFREARAPRPDRAAAADMGPWGNQPCEVLAVEPERLFRYRFSVGRPDTTITGQLSPEGSGTRLTLIPEGFNLDTPLGRMAFEGMNPGWPQVLARLASALPGGRRLAASAPGGSRWSNSQRARVRAERHRDQSAAARD